MKTILALLALLSLAAFAQNVRGTPPSYCHPCLFYGGDFDPTNPNANSLANADTLGPSVATTYIPFYVRQGQIWTVTGLFSNNLSNIQYLIPQQIQWSISTGVSAGNAGTVLGSGTIYATWTPTGRSFDGFTEYTALGHLTPQTAVTLTSGVYWMTAVPMCTRSVGYCHTASYFVTDVEDVPAPNHKGVQPNDDAYFSYFFGNTYQQYFVPTWGADGACTGVGCDKFSAGLLGYAKPSD